MTNYEQMTDEVMLTFELVQIVKKTRQELIAYAEKNKLNSRDVLNKFLCRYEKSIQDKREYESFYHDL